MDQDSFDAEEEDLLTFADQKQLVRTTWDSGMFPAEPSPAPPRCHTSLLASQRVPEPVPPRDHLIPDGLRLEFENRRRETLE